MSDYESAENTAHMLNTFTDYYSEEGELTFEEAFKYIAHILPSKEAKEKAWKQVRELFL